MASETRSSNHGLFEPAGGSFFAILIAAFRFSQWPSRKLDRWRGKGEIAIEFRIADIHFATDLRRAADLLRHSSGYLLQIRQRRRELKRRRRATKISNVARQFGRSFNMKLVLLLLDLS